MKYSKKHIVIMSAYNNHFNGRMMRGDSIFTYVPLDYDDIDNTIATFGQRLREIAIEEGLIVDVGGNSELTEYGKDLLIFVKL